MRFNFISVLLFSSFCGYSQSLTYEPLPSLEASEDLKNALEVQLARVTKEIDFKNAKKLREVYTSRTENLLDKLEEGQFLGESELSGYISEIVSEIVDNNPSLKAPDLVLLDRSAVANAYCVGEGTLAVHLGLFHRLENRDQIAFVIAHEIAHWHLNHVDKMIRHSIEAFSKRQMKEQGVYERLKAGDTEALSSLVYKSFRYSREVEVEADSMALQLIRNTKYDARAYQRMMVILDSVDAPKYESPHFLDNWLYLENYPFKGKWLMPQKTSGLYNEHAPSFIFGRDSLATHPHISDRVAALNLHGGYKDQAYETIGYPGVDAVDREVQQWVDYEIIASSLRTKNYAYCLYYLNHLANTTPKNTFVDSTTVALFYDLYMARKNHDFGKSVPSYLDPDHWLSETVTFLNKVRMSEYLKISYWYLRERVPFDDDNESHYYWYWKTAKEMDTEEAQKYSKAYRSRFPNGRFESEIFDPISE